MSQRQAKQLKRAATKASAKASQGDTRMDIRGEDHPAKAPLPPALVLEGAAPVAVSGAADESARLRYAVRVTCHNQIDAFLEAIDPESGMPMIDVLGAHAALGFGINVGVQVQHPANPERVVQDPSLTKAQTTEAPKLVLVP